MHNQNELSTRYILPCVSALCTKKVSLLAMIELLNSEFLLLSIFALWALQILSYKFPYSEVGTRILKTD